MESDYWTKERLIAVGKRGEILFLFGDSLNHPCPIPCKTSLSAGCRKPQNCGAEESACSASGKLKGPEGFF
jgi:hypothetical protein